MKKKVYAAIIGGGPSGISCAIHLQRQGKTNCVIDKCVFPRNKTCAGLVSYKTYRLIRELLCEEEALLDQAFCHTVSDVVLYDRDKPVANAHVDLEYHMVYRYDFDLFMVGVYKAAGGEMLEGQKHYVINDSAKTITLENGDEIEYEYLVYADGALSRAYKDFGIRREGLGFCIETFMPNEEPLRNAIQMHFGYESKGYIWLFPYGDRISAGIISSADAAKKLPGILEQYMKEEGIYKDSLIFKGAYIPYGKTVDQHKVPDHVLLIGDAGGFVDPVYGEGLYFALLTGKEAALALDGSEPKKIFLKQILPAYQMIKSGAKLRHHFDNPKVMNGLLKKGIGKNAFLKFYCDKQIASYQYHHTDSRMLIDYRRQK